MSIIATDFKTTEVVRKETVNWVDKMALSSPADTIASSTWTADNGLIVDSKTNTTTATTATISGGRTGAYCNLTNFIVTAAGYEYDSTIVIDIRPN